MPQYVKKALDKVLFGKAILFRDGHRNVQKQLIVVYSIIEVILQKCGAENLLFMEDFGECRQKQIKIEIGKGQRIVYFGNYSI